jgi:hypothetical protein
MRWSIWSRNEPGQRWHRFPFHVPEQLSERAFVEPVRLLSTLCGQMRMSALKKLFHCVVVDRYSTYLEIISPNLDESLALEEGKSTFASLDIQSSEP